MTRSYESPRIQSLNARQILERIGPVQGYDGRGTHELLDSSLSNHTPSRISRD